MRRKLKFISAESIKLFAVHQARSKIILSISGFCFLSFYSHKEILNYSCDVLYEGSRISRCLLHVLIPRVSTRNLLTLRNRRNRTNGQTNGVKYERTWCRDKACDKYECAWALVSKPHKRRHLLYETWIMRVCHIQINLLDFGESEKIC